MKGRERPRVERFGEKEKNCKDLRQKSVAF